MNNMIEAVTQSLEQADALREAFIATMTAKHSEAKAKFMATVADRMIRMASIVKMVRDPVVNYAVNDFIVDLCTDLTVLEADKLGITSVEEINALGEEARTYAGEMLDMLLSNHAQFKEQEGVILH